MTAPPSPPSAPPGMPHVSSAGMDALAAALRPTAPLLTSLPALFAAHDALSESVRCPIDRAIAIASRTDRAGLAFAVGYDAALHALVPTLPLRTRACLAVTEPQDAHPRALQTMLVEDAEGLSLVGQKSFVTLGSERGVLLVAARLPDGGERPRLAVVQVGAHTSGVTVEPLPELPFVPEVPHASVRFDAVRLDASARLPGDGYDEYVKPFRTVEDVHVHAAIVAMLLATATRLGLAEALREELAMVLLTLRALAQEPPSAPGVHIALAGCLRASERLLTALEGPWAERAPEGHARWMRDRALLGVARKARAVRLERAWVRV